MSETPAGTQSGRCAYKELIELQSHKPVYALASHSHFIMTDIYGTSFWRGTGNLPGILVGTAGAVRYRLPEPAVAGHQDAATCMRDGRSFCAQTDVYGYLLVTVNPKGTPGIKFEFRPIREKDIPKDVQRKFSRDTMNVCFKGNKQTSPSVDTTQSLPDGPCPSF